VIINAPHAADVDRTARPGNDAAAHEAAYDDKRDVTADRRSLLSHRYQQQPQQQCTPLVGCVV